MSAASPRALPVEGVLPALLGALERTGSAVLRASTGAGKTTRVPPALLAAGLAGRGRVVVLEPRRVAARAAARRIAAENGWTLGEEVGYRVRFERRAGPRTRILFVTEGVLLRRLQDDPFLDGVGALVFDEFHERRLEADLALAMARRIQREVRGDLKILVMSATLAAEPVAAFLGGCPVVESEGRAHPVEVIHLGSGQQVPAGRLPLIGRMAAAVVRALDSCQGGVLAFLPGVGEILALEKKLAPLARERGLTLLPLYGDLPPERQDAALAPAAGRKVVLATNVAETSVTVEGVEAVVDCGLARVLSYDAACGLDRLEVARISRASAEQRRGRAGRLGPGLCLRLWSEVEHRGLAAEETPEIHRLDLAPAVLQLLAWGAADPAAFPWLEPPEPAALERALDLLRRLGALGSAGLTAQGRALSRLPAHPRLGRLLLEGAARGEGRRAALVAALLAERSPFGRPDVEAAPPPPSASDLVDRAEVLEAFERGGRLPPASLGMLRRGAARRVLAVRDQLARLAHQAGEDADGSGAVRSGAAGKTMPAEALRRAVLAAYPDRVAKRRSPGSPRGVMVGGRGVLLRPESAVREAELFVCAELDAGRRGERAEGWVRLASGIEGDWLSPEAVETAFEVSFDEASERVRAFRRTRYADLVIAEAEVAPAPAEAERCLAEAASADPGRALPLADPAVSSFLTRLACLRAWRPELDLPELGEEALRALVPQLATGRRSFEELRRAPLLDVLRGSLSYAQLQALEAEAPERFPLPGGGSVKLQYAPGEPPVLAARIQELFGVAETPRIGGGRVSVLLHLLAPNMRPQQVTQDLASFWRTTYAAVRKELAGRYPKHAWPEDPLSASPERKPRRRGS